MRSSVRPEKLVEGSEIRRYTEITCAKWGWIFVLHSLCFSGMTDLLLASIATSVHTIIRPSLLEVCLLGQVLGQQEVGHKAWGTGRLCQFIPCPPPKFILLTFTLVRMETDRMSQPFWKAISNVYQIKMWIPWPSNSNLWNCFLDLAGQPCQDTRARTLFIVLKTKIGNKLSVLQCGIISQILAQPDNTIFVIKRMRYIYMDWYKAIHAHNTF